jgi:hypothetical protein
MKFRVEINTDNAAFSDVTRGHSGERAGEELARILHALADDLDGIGAAEIEDRFEGMPLLDWNGNTSGRVTIQGGAA